MGANHPGLHIKDGNLRSCTEQEQAIVSLQPSAFIITVVTEVTEAWGWAFPLCFAPFSVPNTRRIRTPQCPREISHCQRREHLASRHPVSWMAQMYHPKERTEIVSSSLSTSAVHAGDTRSAPPHEWPIQFLQGTWSTLYIYNNAEEE